VLILPAIDLRGGYCVRLRQGDYSQETVFDTDAVAVARRWVRLGATYLHVVDLDGAREGRPVNSSTVQRIAEAAGVPCQLGGGLRTDEHIAEALRLGVARVIVGTRAINDPDWLERIGRRFPAQIVLGIDARGGRLATDGWQKESELSALEFARRCASWPLAAFVYTDISRDGMMQGPNFDALAELTAAVPLPVIASGGVTTLEDIRRLTGIGLAGCIVGRALYEGKLDLAQAIAAGESSALRTPSS
jgi:phosphoribosylformimino-5-aminoimidazole carboxamide ribotide isomerase